MRSAAWVSVIVAAMILMLAVPRFAAATWLSLRDPVMLWINYQVPVAEPDLRGLIASRELAREWVATGEIDDEVAIAYSLLALLREPDSPGEEALFRRADAATRASLARVPANPRAWARLAQLQTLRDGPGRPSAAALQLALRTGRYDRIDLLVRRLYLGLLQWAFYDEAERDRLRQQVRWIWREAPGAIVALADDIDAGPALHAAVQDMPAVRDRFIELLQPM